MKAAVLLLVVLIACSAQMDSSDEHIEKEHEEDMQLYGPGLPPMTHMISLRQFDRVDDISPQVVAPKERMHKIELTTKEVVAELAPNVTYWYWTFNETVPGPMLRVREGDIVEILLTNDKSSSHTHSIDLHAMNGPGGGAAVTQVAPGETKNVSFVATHSGVYVYHCATPNVPTHMANGMYGLIVVEPKEGLRPVDHEFYIMQGELYTKDRIGATGQQEFSAQKMLEENPEYIVFNGKVGAIVDVPAQAKVGDTVRVFVGNGGVAKLSSFHVIGEIFDSVHLEGAREALHNIQTTAIPAGGASIVEFAIDVPGQYVFVDHALARVDRGAWGLLKVEE